VRALGAVEGVGLARLLLEVLFGGVGVRVGHVGGLAEGAGVDSVGGVEEEGGGCGEEDPAVGEGWVSSKFVIGRIRRLVGDGSGNVPVLVGDSQLENHCCG
jgi:hypothetical protein